ncbi:MAG: hypothetical protein U5J83_09680 [Bryobacterales bacterium]|nr:hypothetical protein [Bryobacterales bacterium]
MIALEPIEQPRIEIDLAQSHGEYAAGRRVVPMPEYRRYVDDFRKLAAAVSGEAALPTSLDHELAVQETLLRASGMMT